MPTSKRDLKPHVFGDIYERAAIACETLRVLQDLNADLEEKSAEEVVRGIEQSGAIVAAADPNLPLTTPQAVENLKTLIAQYNHKVVRHAQELRNYVTNKLIEESEAHDPRIRIKALELLGKISDVGLFTDKTEITIRHQSTEDLERLLLEKLEAVQLIDGEVVEVLPAAAGAGETPA